MNSEDFCRDTLRQSLVVIAQDSKKLEESYRMTYSKEVGNEVR
jgi:hypothetical protein